MTTALDDLTFPAENVLIMFLLIRFKAVAMHETIDYVKQQEGRKCQLCRQQTWSPNCFSYSISIGNVILGHL